MNGTPVPDEGLPIGGCVRMPAIEVKVAPQHVLILPSALAWQGNNAEQTRMMMQRVSDVHERDVLGRVVE